MNRKNQFVRWFCEQTVLVHSPGTVNQQHPMIMALVRPGVAKPGGTRCLELHFLTTRRAVAMERHGMFGGRMACSKKKCTSDNNSNDNNLQSRNLQERMLSHNTQREFPKVKRLRGSQNIFATPPYVDGARGPRDELLCSSCLLFSWPARLPTAQNCTACFCVTSSWIYIQLIH